MPEEHHDNVPEISWHALDNADVIKQLECNSDLPKKGLTSAECEARIEKYGPNKLSEREKVTLLQRIWHQVANVLVGILVFVAVVSAIRAGTADPKRDDDVGTVRLTNTIQVGLILFVITVNTIIGIVQEGSAEKAAEALKAMLSSEAILIRDGKEQKVEASLIVPGDVVKLSTGDRVPADLRMVEVNNLACQEAALTGESVPVDKTVDAIVTEEGDPSQTPLGDRTNMCFSATLVAQGSGIGIVVHTGDHTEIGTINALVNKVEKKKTNVLEQIDTVSKWLAVFILITAIVTFLVAWLKSGEDPFTAVSTALVCAVAMIPEGLEAIVTMTYAWAVSNMAKNNAIIRALPAVETLGSVTTICSDKTGTLTQNLMSLTAFVTSGKRYRIDVNSSDRTVNNFVADESFMARRAAHHKFRKARSVIKAGPSASRNKRGRRGSTFPFGITTGFSTEHASGHSGNTPSDHPVPDDQPEEKEPQTFEAGESPDEAYVRQALAGGVLCSKCVLGENGGRAGEIGNPTELSILRAVYMTGVDVAEMKDSAPVIAEVPFSSEYKFMATVHEPLEANDGSSSDNLIVHVKGAPDRMIPLCEFQAKDGVVGDDNREPLDKKYWIEQIAILSSHGLRVLALCRGSMPKGSVKQGDQLGPEFVNERDGPWLTIVGLCAIMDPPRPECVQAVAEAHGAGVRVCMITGDHRDTALAIGSMLGLVDDEHSEAITGPELDAMDDEELKVAAKKYNVFARASPQNKIRIVKALQSEGEVCGMTGDGVNDAPALKAADMGVAMGKEGTDVAREASEMILADDNFATIITAVREGRVVWDDLRKVLLVNTPINNAQGMSVLFGLICGLPETPLSSIQVLYCNLICAVTLGFVTAVEPAEDGIMLVPPRRVGKRLIGRFLFLRIVIGTITLVCTTVGSVFWVRSYNDYSVVTEAPATVPGTVPPTTGLFDLVGTDATGANGTEANRLLQLFTSNNDTATAPEEVQDDEESEPQESEPQESEPQESESQEAEPQESEPQESEPQESEPTVEDESQEEDEPQQPKEKYTIYHQRSQALNTLSFGAVAVTISARFSYNSSFHPRIFFGNALCWYSVLIMAALQAFITYTPVVNELIFSMHGMDGLQWGIVVLFMFTTLIVMETEKAIRRYLNSLGEDTDDREYGYFDDVVEPDTEPLPSDVNRFGKTEIRR